MRPFHASYSFFPETTGTFTIGSNSLRWLEGFFTNLDVSTRATVPTPTNSTDAATKGYVDGLFNPVIGTIEEVDGSPSYTQSTTLRFDQADGFVLTQPSSGVVRVDLAAIPNAVLANSSVTINTPTGMSGGGAVSLGGTLTLALANDLSALEGLGSTGIAVRTAADTWAQRTITSTGSTVTITNPGGVAGNINLEVNAVPSGAIVMVDSGSCPSGYTEITTTRGRFIVGVPASGTLAGTAGSAMTDLQNLSVTPTFTGSALSSHTHTFTGDALAGHTHSHAGGTEIGSATATYNVNTTSVSAGTPSGTNSNTSAGTPAGTVSAVASNSLAPYIQLMFCKKD